MKMYKNKVLAAGIIFSIIISMEIISNPEIAIQLYSKVRYGTSVSFEGVELKLKDEFYILFKEGDSYAIKHYKSARKAVVLTKFCPKNKGINECLKNSRINELTVFQNDECFIIKGRGSDTSYLVIDVISGLSVFTSDKIELSISELKNYCSLTKG